MGSILRLGRLIGATIMAGSGAIFYSLNLSRESLELSPQEREYQYRVCQNVPTRDQNLARLQSGEEYDLLVIGGGATGSGVALDGATRGLKVAMVERGDYSSGTSSKSTKLIHGGVRYLEKAFLELDYEQFLMVKEALRERLLLLTLAPHLAYEVPIIIPIYQWWKIPYYFAGSKCYDLVAGRFRLDTSYFVGKEQTLSRFPHLSSSHLKASMVYFDGQSNDARLNLAVALTANAIGAHLANYVQVESLVKEDGKVRGAKVRDLLTNKTWTIKAKGVINATGPFTDSIRQMDEPSSREIVQPSSGAHVILPKKFTPSNFGMLDPSTSDGRVIFLLPWEGRTLVGTTDQPCKVEWTPSPTQEEVDFILNEVRKYLDPSLKLDRSHVLAAWAGIRPLVSDPNKEKTEALVRNHVIHVSPSSLITIAGGKWTTYRSMAMETVDTAVSFLGLKPKSPSLTHKTVILGAHHFSKTLHHELQEKYGLDEDVAQHLASSYGDKAFEVAEISKDHKRLSADHPFLESEVIYSVQKEHSVKISDVICRRMRLGFVDVRAANQSLGRVADLMAPLLSWSPQQKEKEIQQASIFLRTMGLALVSDSPSSSSSSSSSATSPSSSPSTSSPSPSASSSSH